MVPVGKFAMSRKVTHEEWIASPGYPGGVEEEDSIEWKMHYEMIEGIRSSILRLNYRHAHGEGRYDKLANRAKAAISEIDYSVMKQKDRDSADNDADFLIDQLEDLIDGMLKLKRVMEDLRQRLREMEPTQDEPKT
jgi:hypothetical protein